MSKNGDNGTGSGGTWTVNDTVAVCIDRNGDAGQVKSDVINILKNAGKNVIDGGIGPDTKYRVVRGKTNTTVFWIVNGVDQAMCYEFYTEAKESGWQGTGNNIVTGFHTGGQGVCTLQKISNPNLGNAWDAGYATSSMRKNMMGTSAGDWCAKAINCGWVAGPDAKSLAEAFLKGKGGGSGSNTVANINEGYTMANKGTTPQFWNAEDYDPYYEISFTNFEITDENPRIKTATFESTTNIDMTSGRVAVLITGDCNDFGGIILKKEYDSQNRIYKYQCQGFMDRIMANPIYLVANGSKTVHRIIKETLADCGLPDVNLLSEDEYDVAITEETREMMEADKDLSESTEIFTNTEDFTTSKESSTPTSSSSSSDSDDEDNTIKTVTQTLSSTENNKIRNTFKRKPTGIYDCETYGDLIRTLIYNYGVNVDFYGDINGIPHFDIMDLETWTRTGWYIAPDRGFAEDFQYSFDITNIITQVGIKNIQAINGVGEIYTSLDLLGVNLENFVGRMGVIEENPSANVTINDNTEETVNQLKEVYQDSKGRTYNKTEILDTNGQPSCTNCAKKNGGLQPVQKNYSKSWVNKCPGCNSTGTLKNNTSVSNDYKTVCSKCKLEFCQYCGYERKTGKYQLTELWQTSENSTNTTKTEENG